MRTSIEHVNDNEIIITINVQSALLKENFNLIMRTDEDIVRTQSAKGAAQYLIHNINVARDILRDQLETDLKEKLG